MSSASVSNIGFGVMTLDVCRPTPSELLLNGNIYPHSEHHNTGRDSR